MADVRGVDVHGGHGSFPTCRRGSSSPESYPGGRITVLDGAFLRGRTNLLRMENRELSIEILKFAAWLEGQARNRTRFGLGDPSPLVVQPVVLSRSGPCHTARCRRFSTGLWRSNLDTVAGFRQTLWMPLWF
jgi:hypothetical protein